MPVRLRLIDYFEGAPIVIGIYNTMKDFEKAVIGYIADHDNKVLLSVDQYDSRYHTYITYTSATEVAENIIRKQRKEYERVSKLGEEIMT